LYSKGAVIEGPRFKSMVGHLKGEKKRRKEKTEEKFNRETVSGNEMQFKIIRMDIVA